jgi:uncharacterized protein involved in type VI secretion and phage assembly
VHDLLNLMKAQAAGLDAMGGVLRCGTVSSFDPTRYAAKVLIQPENVLTGWLPVAALWAGSGWGVAAPLSPGMQVIVAALEGNAEQGIVIGALWSNVDAPVAAPVGELWLTHQTGSFLKLHNDGTVEIKASTVNIDGNLVVSGDVSDQAGQHGSVRTLRTAYDQHVHTDPQGGTTGLPSQEV